MSHRVTALYHDLDKARLAREDVQTAGVAADQIVLVDGRLEIQARTMDQALNVQGFLRQDGANSVEIREGTDEVLATDTIPHVPAG